MTDTRSEIANLAHSDEGQILHKLIERADLSKKQRDAICKQAIDLIKQVREDSNPGLMEVFLAEYGLSTKEGVALMCLAEALLRVPDAETIDALIEDKIAPSDWGKHLGASSSSLVNASTWALLLTGKVLADEDDSLLGNLRSVVKRLGEPVIRTAVGRAMREMGHQFVLGRNINEAMEEAQTYESQGYTYSYDMLGEAARTEDDAKRYHLSYSKAISALSSACTAKDIRENPGISVKLSALHPRYEYQQHERVMEELVPRTRSLALLAKSASMGFNIDAEEADRLDISLDVIEAVLSDPSLKGWDGFGVVVQGYGVQASNVLDWLYDLATRLDRRIMVRLVKGAYWDTEIKLSQTLGSDSFPVFTRKPSTDVSYISNARKLLGMTDRIYPQFATHNAHTVSAILNMSEDKDSFEFQRLHGMGESLHGKILKKHNTRCRIYAPVGAHSDLLAYLVRRLLENGANSSFVNQIVDEDVSPEEIAVDPFDQVKAYLNSAHNPLIRKPVDLYGKERRNAKGWNIQNRTDVASIRAARQPFLDHQWNAYPLVAGYQENLANGLLVTNPANPKDKVGTVSDADQSVVELALENAATWNNLDPEGRAEILNRAADLFEENYGELFTLLAREAGKTLLDCIGELREAVDFLRYYANEALRYKDRAPRGVFACISPWNFPLAIFTGQISAALAAGNGVIAKPAESTSIIAFRAIELLHEAGIPKAVLQLVPGKGSVVGAQLSSSKKIAGMCFTGSTPTAQRINRSMAEHLDPSAPLIAETGGLNAMIVDSTALPEQAVRDIVASAFQSAGQRCSALRVLYVQSDVAQKIIEMLTGAMIELSVGNPSKLSTDIGPVIDENAKAKITSHIDAARSEGRVIKELSCPDMGTYVGPTLIKVNSILDLQEEIFGPVLHIATFEADEVDQVINDINATGYGLTFGLHTRIDDRVQHIIDRVKAGNLYVNRNQIGAIVGSQPFGGEGLSGTGPKAGGPHYVQRFLAPIEEKSETTELLNEGNENNRKELQKTLDIARRDFKDIRLETIDLPGPTGESNRLSSFPKGVILCLGPTSQHAEIQQKAASKYGCKTVTLNNRGGKSSLNLKDLVGLTGFDAVCFNGNEAQKHKIRLALAEREGPLIPLIDDLSNASNFILERHVCVDTTASGGNAELLAAQ